VEECCKMKRWDRKDGDYFLVKKLSNTFLLDRNCALKLLIYN
jgi:hypothetical protein